MNDSEYKNLLERLLRELESVLEACSYHAKRKHRISIAERLESARTAAYIVSLIQQVAPLAEQISRRVAEAEAPLKKSKNDEYQLFLWFEERGVIEIKNLETIKRMFGIEDDQNTRAVQSSS